MEQKKLTILVATCIENGHLNACTGAMLPMLRRDHRVIFVLHELFRGKLAELGFEEHVYPEAGDTSQAGPETSEDQQSPADIDAHAKGLHQTKLIGPFSPKEKLQGMISVLDSYGYNEEVQHTDAAIKVAIEKYKPDVIVVDAHSLPPAVYYSGIPWIKNVSMAPTMEVWFADVPPGGSGFSQNSDRSQWPDFNKIRRQLFFDSKVFRKLLIKMGYEPYPNDVKFPPTEILTVYACPEELNFPQVRESNWFNLEAFNKVDPSGSDSKLEDLLPKEFIADTLSGTWSGKYVYLSMGSIVAVDGTLMKRLTDVLSKTNHKYIVSKGPLSKTYQLPKNMWGAQFLPQTKILPLVDLVLTHCGNNSFTETFARGVPMVALPVFADQLDNAQRLVDTGLGVRVDPYTFQDAELLDAVEKVINDGEIRKRMQAAAKRIQATRKHEELADKIEKLVGK